MSNFDMSNKVGLTLFAAGLLAATVVFAPYAPSAAQERPVSADQQQLKHKGQQKKQKKTAPAARPAPQRAAPQRAAPRVAAPQRTAPRTGTQPRTTSRAVTQRKAAARAIKQPKATRKVVVPAAAGRKAVSPSAASRVVTPRRTRTVTASRLRQVSAHSTGTVVIRGQNYSVRRSGHRIRHGSGWWTFVALGTLGAIAIGPNQYYPYAYISAPGPYCEGLTEDGCELIWQEVETIEGGVVNQCVAYCPWQ